MDADHVSESIHPLLTKAALILFICKSQLLISDSSTPKCVLKGVHDQGFDILQMKII